MLHSTNGDVEYRLLDENDYDRVWDIMSKDFNDNEPVSVHVKLSASSPEFIKHRSGAIKCALKQHASFGAFQKSSGELLGCSLSCLSRETDTSDSEDINFMIDGPLKQIVTMLHLCYDGISSLMGEDDYLEITYMSCRKDYCGRGIGTKLFKRALDIASQKGCKKVFVVAFNHYVQRMAENLGFQYHKEIYYSSYIDPLTETKVFAGVPAPHIKAATMIKSL